MSGAPYDAVVIGGGLAGLTTAALLAGRGRRPLLLEGRSALGGRARTTDHAGHLLNFGPRALSRGAAARVLRRVGVRPGGGSPHMAQGRCLYRGELAPGFAGAGGLARTPLLGLGERAAVARLLATSRPSAGLAEISGADWLARRLPTPRARQAAFALLRVSSYLTDPGQVSADALAGQLRDVRHGVRYLDGGWQAVVDALTAAVERAGGRLRTSAKVVGVEHVTRTGGGAAVHLAGGERIDARAVVLAGLAPGQAAELAGLPALPGPAGEAERHPVRVRSACLDVALSRLPNPDVTFVYGFDEPVYLSVASAAARLAPPGGAVIHLVHYGGQPPGVDTRARLERLLDVCQPGWRDHLVHARFLPSMITACALPDPRTGGLAGRPRSDVPGRPGVYLAGDWVGPEGMLADATVASAARAAAHVHHLLEA
ncbi:phytoene desaturase family protein [Microbispora sp. NPDC049125]|uniref:phytoene desaturase family protein n=1 Tax=Microbispora sp. NPDC049125 TaxID=3154929 RepID=UPI003467AF28